ncbi:TniQ family protein [Ensifer sp. ENS07]|uniref:TniQ family protein n=1 Tax=unclassified Ensifer TaxID=2633371 RepID=UPI0017810758|nr:MULTISPECIES: TniQ family protein [unclassified Ensifer]MBD9508195.1 TniQ family protein [Ensifer sp. ENS10]MBD9637313.1 TniQ family protein [Ensifer sp. ENS07]
MRQLTLTLPRSQDESLASHFSRVAALHGQPTASAFAGVFGISFRKLAAGVSPDVYKAAAALGDTPDSVDASLTRYQKRRLGIRGHLFTRDFACARQRRFCPSCLIEDEEQGMGRPGLRAYGRLSWLPRFVQGCPVHETTLVEFDPLAWHFGPDFTLYLRSSRTSLAEYQRRARPAANTAFQQFVLGRLAGAASGQWLDSIPLQALGHLATVVGMTTRGETAVSPREDEKVIRDCAPDGFAILASGENAFREFLSSVIARNYTPRRKLSALIIYRELATEMSFHRDEPGYRDILAIMQSVARDMLPLGSNEGFLEAVGQRHLHSIHSASKEFEIPFTILWAALEEKKLVPTGLSPWTVARMTFEAESVADVARALLESGFAGSEAHKRFSLSARLAAATDKTNFEPADWLTLEQATRKLGTLNRELMAALVDDGYLTEIEAPTQDAPPRIRKADIEEFCRKYVLEPSFHKWVSRKTSLEPSAWLNSLGIAPALPEYRMGMNIYSMDSYAKASRARSARS